MIETWPCSLADGRTIDEGAVRLGDAPAPTILIIPPLFGEHNLMRRQIVEVMRRLADVNVSTVLPDLPGWNESLQPLDQQTLAGWRSTVLQAMKHFDAGFVLAVRSGALLAPDDARGWHYAPQSGAKLLRTMMRARILASREAGLAEDIEALSAEGRTNGLTLAGWAIGPTMFDELETAGPVASDRYKMVEQSSLGGGGLWLRAEPGEDAAQADALASLILNDLGISQ